MLQVSLIGLPLGTNIQNGFTSSLTEAGLSPGGNCIHAEQSRIGSAGLSFIHRHLRRWGFNMYSLSCLTMAVILHQGILFSPVWLLLCPHFVVVQWEM